MEDHKIYIYQLEDIDDIKEEGKWSLYFVLSSYSIDLIRPIFQKINRLKERGSDIEVIIRTYDKNFSDEEIHTFTSLETILSIIHVPLYFDGGYKDYYSLEELIKTDKILDDVINRIKQAHLSPLETFLAVYQYLLKFQYKAESLNKEDEHPEESLYLSRDIISILNSDYIVCEGYARIMEYLLDNLGITCFKQTLSLSEGAHMNNLVYLQDDKYQIKGLYYSDSCWDAEDDALVFSLLPLSDVSKINHYIDIHSGYLPFYHVRNYKMLEDYQLLDAFLRSDQVYPDLIKKHHLEYYLEDTYNQGIDLFIKNRNAAISLLVDTLKEMHIDADIYDITNGTLPYGTSLPFFTAMLILSKDNIVIVKHQLRQILHFFETGLNKLSDEERPYFNKEMINNSSAGIMDLYDYLSKVQKYPYETLNLSLPLMQQLFNYENDYTPNPCLIFSYETINILQRAFMLPKIEEAASRYNLGEPISLAIFRHALTESMKVEHNLSQEEIAKKANDMIERTILLSKDCFYEADNCFYKEPTTLFNDNK